MCFHFQFSSLVCIKIGITSSPIGLKTFAITAEIKKYNSIFKKKKMRHDILVLLAKATLNSIKVLNSKALIDSVIRHDELILISNVRKEHNLVKEETANLET